MEPKRVLVTGAAGMGVMAQAVEALRAQGINVVYIEDIDAPGATLPALGFDPAAAIPIIKPFHWREPREPFRLPEPPILWPAGLPQHLKSDPGVRRLYR